MLESCLRPKRAIVTGAGVGLCWAAALKRGSDESCDRREQRLDPKDGGSQGKGQAADESSAGDQPFQKQQALSLVVPLHRRGDARRPGRISKGTPAGYPRL